MVLQRQQRGMSLIVWIVVIGVFGFFVVIGVKSLPIYLNHFKIVTAMKRIAAQPTIADESPEEIRKSIDRSFEIDMVLYVDAKDLKVINDKTGRGRVLLADYEVRIPLIYNVDAVYKFKEEIPLPGK